MSRNLETLHEGQNVIVSNAKYGSVRALVLDAIAPVDFPEIPGAPPVAQVREYMNELGVAQVCHIAHMHSGREVVFSAFGDGRGNWFDLRRQKLEITDTATARPQPLTDQQSKRPEHKPEPAQVYARRLDAKRRKAEAQRRQN